MRYSILIYDSEEVIERLSPAENKARLGRHIELQQELRREGKLGPVARLLPSTTAVTLRAGGGEPLVIDGPFAETKEQLVGFYVFECASLEEAISKARLLPLATGSLEIRPISWWEPGVS